MPGLGGFGARDGDRAAGDLQDVAGPGADAHRDRPARRRAMACADVLDARFRDAQRDGGRRARRRRSAGVGHRTRSVLDSRRGDRLQICRAKRSNTAASFCCSAWSGDRAAAMATRCRSRAGVGRARIVPRLVCSIAQPSLLTAVTAMLSVVASLSHGTTIAVTWPCARAYSSIARGRPTLRRSGWRRNCADRPIVSLRTNPLANAASAILQLCYTGPVVEPVRTRSLTSAPRRVKRARPPGALRGAIR